jgi:hypothetical protein
MNGREVEISVNKEDVTRVSSVFGGEKSYVRLILKPHTAKQIEQALPTGSLVEILKKSRNSVNFFDSRQSLLFPLEKHPAEPFHS